MKSVVRHHTYGEIVYTEGVVGNRELSFNGIPLRKISSTDFEYTPVGESPVPVRLYGSYLGGLSLNVNGEQIQVVPKLRWYEAVLSVLIFAIVMVWSSVPSLISVLPVVGGAVGGALSGLIAVVNLLLIKGTRSVWMKLLITVGMMLLALLVCAAVGWLIVRLIR